MNIKDTLIHRWLKIPYALHVMVRESSSKKAPTILFIHGIGNSGEAWEDVVRQLPKTYRIVAIDLLGFGKSPRPSWGKYDAKRQARAVFATFAMFWLKGPVVIVGHSLGALVAIEMAKRYPFLARQLILCSPPFYKIDEKKHLLPTYDAMLREIYRLAKKHPEQFIRIGMLGVKLGLVNKRFNLTDAEAPIYMNALESSIINQTAFWDAQRVHIPTRIIYGRRDPVVIFKNLQELAQKNEHITIQSINASHEVRSKIYIDTVAHTVKEAVKEIEAWQKNN